MIADVFWEWPTGHVSQTVSETGWGISWDTTHQQLQAGTILTKFSYSKNFLSLIILEIFWRFPLPSERHFVSVLFACEHIFVLFLALCVATEWDTKYKQPKKKVSSCGEYPNSWQIPHTAPLNK